LFIVVLFRVASSLHQITDARTNTDGLERHDVEGTIMSDEDEDEDGDGDGDGDER
jgi:hypothetical protein